MVVIGGSNRLSTTVVERCQPSWPNQLLVFLSKVTGTVGKADVYFRCVILWCWL